MPIFAYGRCALENTCCMKWWDTKHEWNYWQEKKGDLQGRRSEGGIWGRQDCSQHSVACTSANERGKGSASNYTEIMAISWNHGNSCHPARLPPPLPHPLAALSSYFTPLKWILFKKRKKKRERDSHWGKSMQSFLSVNDCRGFCICTHTAWRHA